MNEWKIFVLGREKTPLPNCPTCAVAGPEHDREACDHLTCHGFYAGTSDRLRQAEMMRRHPDGYVAVRTGAASGIIVLDAEGHGDPSGTQVLDDWENWTGHSLPSTQLHALTPSGGAHLFYRWEPGVRSRNRVLPGIDIKSDGGYVVIPYPGTDPGRRWIMRGLPGDATGPFLAWLRSARGSRTGGGGVVGHSGGYDYQRFLEEGCPGGSRDEFFNDLIFRLRRRDVNINRVYAVALEHWRRAKQPPNAQWYMPWHHVEGKIRRIFQTVEPARVAPSLREWAAGQTGAPRMTSVPRT